MIKNIFITVIAIFSLGACKYNNAFKYSEDFVASEKKLIPNIERTENSVERYIDKGHYDSIVFVSEKMEMQIDSLIVTLKAKPAPDAKLGEKFKADVVRYFIFLKSIYTSYKNYGKATTDEGRNEELKKMQQIASKKEEVIKAVQQSQSEYAKENGFKIENK